MRKFRASILLFFSVAAQGQTDTALLAPAQHTMPEVVVTAYEQRLLHIDVPAAVSTVRKQELDRYGNSSVLPAVNNMPGVKMEERSPGSFRLGIRGSAFNAPFGVRNVKVYYNGIPFTDPGGTTFFNQLGYYNFQSLEVVKGPGSSLYGAGTGGVVLINSLSDTWQSGATVHYTGGSYGYSNVATELKLGDTGTRHVLRYQHVAGNGYREHAAIQNDVVTYDMQLIRDGK
ncbi:MAG: Plug domain-containing protein, partial [Taibaiella sp.]|nr:Plug domain-containing protein [Taibaiella sp.]